VLDLLGDLGGAAEVIIAIIGVLVSPISQFSFNLSAIKKLFIARQYFRANPEENNFKIWKVESDRILLKKDDK
jgi:hypothetical protein